MLGPDRSPPGWPSTRRPERAGLAVHGTWARGTGDGHRRSRSPPPDGAGALRRPDPADAGRRAGAGRWLADGAAQGAARRQGPDARARRARLDAARASAATPPSPPTWRCPASGPSTWPTCRCATSGEELRRRGRRRRPAHAGRLRRAGGGDRADAGGARGHPRPGGRARRRTSRSAARPGCCTTSSCRSSRAGRDGADRHRRRRRPPGRAVEPTFDGEVKAAEQAAYAVVGHEFNLGSPKQLQEVLFDELGLPKTKKTKTGYTTDAEALTRPARRRPSTRCSSTSCATATSPSSRRSSTA